MKDFMRELVKKKLRGLRAENNYSLQDVSNKLKEKGIDIHRETLRRYENDWNKMPLGLFITLLELYGINVFIFFENICANSHNK